MKHIKNLFQKFKNLSADKKVALVVLNFAAFYYGGVMGVAGLNAVFVLIAKPTPQVNPA